MQSQDPLSPFPLKFMFLFPFLTKLHFSLLEPLVMLPEYGQTSFVSLLSKRQGLCLQWTQWHMITKRLKPLSRLKSEKFYTQTLQVILVCKGMELSINYSRHVPQCPTCARSTAVTAAGEGSWLAAFGRDLVEGRRYAANPIQWVITEFPWDLAEVKCCHSWFIAFSLPKDHLGKQLEELTTRVPSHREPIQESR